MALASLLAGIVMGNADTTIGHACGYAFVYPATKLHYPHGYAIAITLPYVMEYNAIAQIEKHATIAEVLGEEIEACRCAMPHSWLQSPSRSCSRTC